LACESNARAKWAKHLSEQHRKRALALKDEDEGEDEDGEKEKGKQGREKGVKKGRGYLKASQLHWLSSSRLVEFSVGIVGVGRVGYVCLFQYVCMYVCMCICICI